MLMKPQTMVQLPWHFPLRSRMNSGMRACMNWVTLSEYDTVLDLSCGEGELLEKLLESLPLTVCGLSETMEQARSARERLDGADIMSGSKLDIPWRNNHFDAVLMTDVVFDTRFEKVMAEVCRVLRPGGQLVMTIPLLRGNYYSVLSNHEAMNIMENSGFQEVSYRIDFPSGVFIAWKAGVRTENQWNQAII